MYNLEKEKKKGIITHDAIQVLWSSFIILMLSLYAYFNEALIIKIFILNLTITQIHFSQFFHSYNFNSLDK